MYVRSLFIVLFVSTLLFTNNWLIGNGADHNSHYQMALSRANNTIVFEPQYSPLLPTIGTLFASSEESYKTLIIILLAIITPLLIVGITKKWYGALFYFSLSNYFYATIAGHYAQGLLIIFFLSILYFKDNRIRLLLLIIGSLSHSQAFMVLSGTYILLLINEKKMFSIFPVGICSPFWGENKPIILTKYLSNVGHEPSSLSINDLLGIITKKTPLPFLYVAIKGFIERKEYHLIVLGIISVVGGFFYNDRIFDLLSILMIIGFTKSYHGLSDKKIWIFLVIMHLLINILSFVKTGIC